MAINEHDLDRSMKGENFDPSGLRNPNVQFMQMMHARTFGIPNVGPWTAFPIPLGLSIMSPHSIRRG